VTDFDIIVIGAGIAGASVSAHLAEHNSVLLLEAESQPGYHSTGRSAALFSEAYGGAVVRALSRASRAFLFAPPPAFAETPLVRRRGTLFIAREEQLAALASWANSGDMVVRTASLSPAAALQLCPILAEDHLAAALYEPGSADVDVHALHQGYLRLFRHWGGTLKTACPVSAIEPDSRNWRVETNAGSFRAPIIVNAAGAWADHIADLAQVAPIGVRPMRRTAISVAVPAGHVVDDWPLVIGADEDFYFKPDGGKLILSPADETECEPHDVQPEDWDVATAIDRVERATTLRVRRVEHKWAGLRTFVTDRSPVAGFDEHAPGFFWLAGQGGYGIQTAPALARTAARLIVGGDIDAELSDFGITKNELSPSRLGEAIQTLHHDRSKGSGATLS
jgi:D-arginine dehydrogenase